MIHFSSFRRVKDAQWFVRGKEENEEKRGRLDRRTSQVTEEKRVIRPNKSKERKTE